MVYLDFILSQLDDSEVVRDYFVSEFQKMVLILGQERVFFVDSKQVNRIKQELNRQFIKFCIKEKGGELIFFGI